MKLTKPKEPTKPRKPTKPDEFLSKRLEYDIYSGMSIYDFLVGLSKKINTKIEDIDLKFLKFDFNRDWEDDVFCWFTYQKDVLDINYKTNLIEYNKKKKEYESKLEQYKTDLAVYESSDEYKDKQAKIKEYKRKQKEYDIKKLKKQLEKLEND